MHPWPHNENDSQRIEKLDDYSEGRLLNTGFQTYDKNS